MRPPSRCPRGSTLLQLHIAGSLQSNTACRQPACIPSCLRAGQQRSCGRRYVRQDVHRHLCTQVPGRHGRSSAQSPGARLHLPPHLCRVRSCCTCTAQQSSFDLPCRRHALSTGWPLAACILAAAESDSAHVCREGEMPQVQPSSVPAAMASPSGELTTCQASVSAAVSYMRMRIGSSTTLCQPVMYVGFRPPIRQQPASSGAGGCPIVLAAHGVCCSSAFPAAQLSPGSTSAISGRVLRPHSSPQRVASYSSVLSRPEALRKAASSCCMFWGLVWDSMQPFSSQHRC